MSHMAGLNEHSPRAALIVLLLVIFGGAALLHLVDLFVHLGPALGNAVFAALPLMGAAAASTRLDHDNADD